MIQRIQSLWFLLAAFFALSTFKFATYTGTRDAISKTMIELKAGDAIGLIINTLLIATLAVLALFLFKKRALQKRLCIAAMLLQVVLLVQYFLQSKNFIQGNFALAAVLHLGVLALFLLAFLGIQKDEKLVQSYDRLR